MNAKKKTDIPEVVDTNSPSKSAAPVKVRKASARVSEQVAEKVWRITESTMPANRSSAISTFFEGALASGNLNEFGTVVDSTFRGLLAFYDRYLSDGTDPATLSDELKAIYNALSHAFSENLGKHFLTAGSEGEIFRFATEGGEFIVVKRRYDSADSTLGTTRECELQEAACRIAETCEGVAVPKIFRRIPDTVERCEYIFMECVRGKTIWALALETLANEGSSRRTTPTFETHPIRSMYEERSRYSVRYDNDTDAENDMIERYRSYGEKIGSPYDFGTRVINPITREVTYPYLKPYLDADIARTQIFSTETIQHIAARLRPFLTKLHEKGIYHRDLNVRNLMLGEDGLVYVIDFGKGIKSVPNDDSVYHTQEGTYDNDFAILSLVRSYGPKAETDADRIQKAAEQDRGRITPERIAKAAKNLWLDSVKVAASVSRIGQKFGAKYFEGQFRSYADGSAKNRVREDAFISANPKRANTKAATEAGLTQLLAYLLVADREQLEETFKYFDDLGRSLADSKRKTPIFGSEAKDEAARKYLPVFESAVIAAME